MVSGLHDDEVFQGWSREMAGISYTDLDQRDLQRYKNLERSLNRLNSTEELEKLENYRLLVNSAGELDGAAQFFFDDVDEVVNVFNITGSPKNTLALEGHTSKVRERFITEAIAESTHKGYGGVINVAIDPEDLDDFLKLGFEVLQDDDVEHAVTITAKNAQKFLKKNPVPTKITPLEPGLTGIPRSHVDFMEAGKAAMADLQTEVRQTRTKITRVRTLERERVTLKQTLEDDLLKTPEFARLKTITTEIEDLRDDIVVLDATDAPKAQIEKARKELEKTIELFDNLSDELTFRVARHPQMVANVDEAATLTRETQDLGLKIIEKVSSTDEAVLEEVRQKVANITIDLTEFQRDPRPTLRGVGSLTKGTGMERINFLSISQRSSWSEQTQHLLWTEVNNRGLFHEVGHVLEDSSQELQNAAKAWRINKATSGQVKELSELLNNELYGPEEVAFPGPFKSPYVGKNYSNLGMEATEVISTGLEEFAIPADLAAFAIEHEDHFNFTLGVLLDDHRGRKLAAKIGIEP
jgi:hypothetical protein